MRELSTLRRVGFGAFIAYLLIPQVALIVLIGLAVSWWLGALAAVAWLAAWLYVRWLARSIEDEEPLPYSQWTRYLVIQPTVEALPAAVVVPVAVILAIAAEASLAAAVAVGVVTWLIGLAAGKVLWRWLERRHRGALEESGRKDPAA